MVKQGEAACLKWLPPHKQQNKHFRMYVQSAACTVASSIATVLTNCSPHGRPHIVIIARTPR